MKSAPGRFEVIKFRKKNSKIIIDYAHTPDALENILKTFSYDNFKPSLVFGCGGNRDREKRTKMGIVAKKYSNRVYITDDNPRYENPKTIRESIKKFCSKGVIISDRRKAIHEAILKLDVNDILIIAGKGHEKYQLIKNKKIEFNDYKMFIQVQSNVNKMFGSKKKNEVKDEINFIEKKAPKKENINIEIVQDKISIFNDIDKTITG